MNSLLVYRYQITITSLKQFVFLLFIAILISGCNTPTKDGQQTLTIFAASSLSDVFNELSADFETEHPNIDIQVQYTGSSQLAIQISQGAPADIFASANQKQVGTVVSEGLNAGEAQIFAQNELILIVPADNPANILEFSDIERPDLRIVTAVEGVPIRDYTDLLMANLAEDNNYGVKFIDQFYAIDC